MGRGDHLGDLEAMVLVSVLRTQPDAWGTRVYQELTLSTGREASLPAIHVTLRRLQEKGLLTSEQGDRSPRGGRPRRHYRITDDGAAALRAFRRDWNALWEGVRLSDPGEVS